MTPSAPAGTPVRLTLRAYSSVAAVPAAAWDAVVGDGVPFLEHAWLDALERTGCATLAQGWEPCHLTAWRGDQLVALAPAYLKHHSAGEFVFDHSWANLAERLGVAYYPKLIIAIPFTPATGSRFAVRAGEERPALIAQLLRLALTVADDAQASSIHALFCDEADLPLLAPLGFHARADVQFHWQNAGYQSWDDFLGRMTSKRRNQLKRERAQLAKDGLSIETLTGADLAAHARTVHQLYAAHVDKFFYGHRYLTSTLFEQAFQTFSSRLELVLAHRGGKPVACAVNASKAGRRYGRYWGTFEELPFLHFNVCYYQTIERCIADGAHAFEPGTGGLHHKFPRGFLPVLTHSAHWLREPRLDQIITDFLARERPAVVRELEKLAADSPFKR